MWKYALVLKPRATIPVLSTGAAQFIVTGYGDGQPYVDGRTERCDSDLAPSVSKSFFFSLFHSSRPPCAAGCGESLSSSDEREEKMKRKEREEDATIVSTHAPLAPSEYSTEEKCAYY